MASTAGRSTYDSESRPRRSGPQQDQEEDCSDSSNDRQTKQTKSPRRQHRLKHKTAEHYRQHTSESASQFPDDSYIRQARNATVPYGGGYNYNPGYTPSYQSHPNPPLQEFTSPPPQGSAGYPGSYAYQRQGSYLSVPRTENAFEQTFSTTPYPHPPAGYSESNYGFENYNYDQNVPPAPEYPYQDPLRTPVRPREFQIPVSQRQSDTGNKYRDEVERKPRKTRSKRPRSKKEEKTPQLKTDETPQEDRDTEADMMEMLKKFLQDGKLPSMKGEERPALPKTEETGPDDKITKADIEEVVTKILYDRKPPLLEEKETLSEDNNTNAEIIKILKSIQQGVRENAEIRSDPGRRMYRSPAASEFLIDDTTSLGNERHDSRQLKSIIRYLLEDNGDFQSSYAGSSRRGAADRRQNRIEMDYGDTASMSPRDMQSFDPRIDLIMDRLGIGNPPSPRQLPEFYSDRHSSRVSRRQEFPEPSSPTASHSRVRRNEYIPSAGNQWQDTPASNQSRYRQHPSRIPEEEGEEYYEEYDVPRAPLRRAVQGRHPGSNTSIGSQGRGRSQPSVDQRSEFRSRGGRIVPGDQQKVGPGRGPILQPESEYESEGEPVRERDRAPYRHNRMSAPEPPQSWDQRNHAGFRY